MGWTVLGGAGSCLRTDAEVRAGDYSCELVEPINTFSGCGLRSQAVSAVGGELYDISGWFYARTGEGAVEDTIFRYRVEWRDDDGMVLGTAPGLEGFSNEYFGVWEKKEYRWLEAPAGTERATFLVECREEEDRGAGAYIDDFFLALSDPTPVPTVTPSATPSPTPTAEATPSPTPGKSVVPTPSPTATIIRCFAFSGRVTARENGEPLAGARVRGYFADGWTATAVTDGEGDYRLAVCTHYPEGEVAVRARRVGYLPDYRREEYRDWEGEEEVDLELSADGLAVGVADGDYDGDGISEVTIFREATGMWAVRGGDRVYFGAEGDDLVAADYDGDGSAEVAVFRGESGLWAIRDLTRVYYGLAGDVAIPGDYDGDGTAEIAVFRNESGLWAVRGLTRWYFGARYDRPVPGNYDVSGSVRPAIYRPASGLWAVKGVTRAYFGTTGDLLVTGDYTGEGYRRIGVYRPASGLWAIRDLSRFYFGIAGDIPAPAGYDWWFDRPAIFRPRNGLWAIRGMTRAYFGSPADCPATR